MARTAVSLQGQASAAGIDRTQLAVTDGRGKASSPRPMCRRTHRSPHPYFLPGGTGALLTPAHFDLAGTTARILHLGMPVRTS